jgi:hypothetical protein
MKTNKMKFLVLAIVTIFLIAGLVGSALADSLFSDDFESGLTKWTAKSCGSSYAAIVDDPVTSGVGSHQAGNHVLHFTSTNSYGDIFGSPIQVVPGQKYSISFDYLGYPATSTKNNGGFVGFSAITCPTSRANHTWLWATSTTSDASDVLEDDGEWHTYTFQFDPFSSPFAWVDPSGGTIRLMLEQFEGPLGDAYFDNFKIETWLDVTIDIKPGSYPNSINLGSAGVVPVAIFSNESFDATTINPR